jgi:hypothetical protein
MNDPLHETCDRCGSTDYVDTPIHAGNSLRRDCARCGRFVGWPVWNVSEGENATYSTPGGTKVAAALTPTPTAKINSSPITKETTMNVISITTEPDPANSPPGPNIANLKKSKRQFGGHVPSRRKNAPPAFKKKALAALGQLRRLFDQLGVQNQCDEDFEEIEKAIQRVDDSAVAEPSYAAIRPSTE